MEITHVPAKQTGGQEAEKIAEGKWWQRIVVAPFMELVVTDVGMVAGGELDESSNYSIL